MNTRRREDVRQIGDVLLAACLLLVPQTSLGASKGSPHPDADPVSEPISKLVGIYESVPLSTLVPGAERTAPATLDALPLTPGSATQKASSKPGPDPKDMCQVLGPFRMMARPDLRFEILPDAPNKLVMLFENQSWGFLRTINIGVEHRKDFTKVRPMWNGDSVAKWEADTLIVDTIHFTNKTWLNESGVTNSRQLHLTERLRMVDGARYLEYRATAVDPDVLAKPVSYTRYFKRTDKEIREYNCFAHMPDRAATSR